MKIVAISDTHSKHDNIKLPDGDILIHAGDISYTGTPAEISKFIHWFKKQTHKHKILIAGNHDLLFQRDPGLAKMLTKDIIYLQDSMVEIEGKKIYGSPWQPEFMGWAFGLERGSLRAEQIWNRIPDGLDVLVTHGPPYGILDQRLGCQILGDRIKTRKPKHHIFGHIHDGFGATKIEDTAFYNVAMMNDHYDLIHEPTVFDI